MIKDLIIALALILPSFPLYVHSDQRVESSPLQESVFSEKEILDPRLHMMADDKLPRYIIVWDSPYNDGAFDLVIHPNQIILCSSHNNPNSNYLYWFTPLTEKQYHAISTYLANYKEHDLERGGWQSPIAPYIGFTFKNAQKELPLPKEWTEEAKKIHSEDSFDKLYQNTRLLVDLINRSFAKVDQRIPYPSSDFVVKKRFVRLREYTGG